MGWTKETRQPPPARERFHLYYAHQAYISGRMEVEDLEASVEHVLKGGTLRQDGRIAWESVMEMLEAKPGRLRERP